MVARTSSFANQICSLDPQRPFPVVHVFSSDSRYLKILVDYSQEAVGLSLFEVKHPRLDEY